MGAVALVVVAVGALVVAMVPTLFGTKPAPEIPAARVGVVDYSWAAPGVRSPTGHKTEAAKLWFNDGSWWGVLFQPSDDAYTINRYDARRDTWVDTGTVIDDRNDSQADVLWDGTHLYAVSGGADPSDESDGPIVARLTYDTVGHTYRMDRGFPVQIAPTGSEMFTIDKDTTGRLWATWTAQQSVWITHSLADDRHWAAGSILPVDEATDISTDDISAVVAYDDGIGIMWSDQVEGAMLWASAPAGSDTNGPWSVTAVIKAPGMADDHMNLKALHDDPAGLVFAAIKTSRNDLSPADPSDPLIMLAVLRHDGTWSRTVVSTVRQNETRPLLLIDDEHRRAYVLTSGPCCSGGTIYQRSTSLDDITFDPSQRDVALRRGRTSTLNNVTSAKAPLNGTSGMLIIAADDDVRWYMHRFEALTGPAVPKPVEAPVGDDTTGQGTDPTRVVAQTGFEDEGLTGWVTAKGQTLGSRVQVEEAAARTDRLGLTLASNADPGSYAYARLPVPRGGAPFSVDLDFNVGRAGVADGNVPIVRLLAADDSRILSVYRQNNSDGEVWLRSATTRDPTLAKVELSAWTHLTLTLRRQAQSVVAELRMDGRVVGGTTMPAADVDIAAIQVGNETPGQLFRIAIDNVRVRR